MLYYNKLSFWETQTYFEGISFTIVGAGIVGYSTAIELKKRFPNRKILLLERGYLPTGASTKNAGFTCFGSGSEILDDLENQRREEVVDLVRKRYQGLQILLNRCSPDLIRYLPTGSHELFTDSKMDKVLFEKVMDQEKQLNAIIAEATGIEDNYSQVANTFGFQQVHTIVRNKGEGQIDTGLMMQRLHQIAVSMGVLTLFGVEYNEYQKQNGLHVNTNQGTFETAHLIFATNGLSKTLLPNLDIQPARAQVMITQPLKKPIKGTFHYDRGYYYFRSVGNRMLIGGGRNLAFEEETSTAFENTEIITTELQRLLKTVILPNQSFEIAQQWSGIMGIGKNRNPIVEFINAEKTVVAAIRLGGMGVALGSYIGEKVAILFENSSTLFKSMERQ